MDIKELLTFKCIVETGTFSKAAETLCYTQPTITNHIQQLEKSLNFKLFIRGWDAKLTKQGKIFYKEIDSLLEHFNYVKKVALEIDKEEIGTIKIGVLEIYSDKTISKLINWFRSNKPKINVEFILGNTKLLYTLISDKKIDMAFCTLKKEKNNIEFFKLKEEKIKFVTNQEHVLTKESNVTIDSILKYPILMGDRTCITNQQFKKFLYKNEITNLTNALYICSNQFLIPTLIKNEIVGILPESIILKENLEIIEINNFNLEFEYGIIIRKNNKEYLSNTIFKLLEFFKKTII